VIAPLYDPLRLAEEVAVADLCLRGRLELGLGLGVLRADYEAFGVDFSRRGQLMEELIPFLRRAWTGEPREAARRSGSPAPVRPDAHLPA
jgi:alkanesulfonate monooxygenase SsuD/methylene tetrahydromethanopterin reductase-like flavin-dependent oxidoreductase (luciferase family)